MKCRQDRSRSHYEEQNLEQSDKLHRYKNDDVSNVSLIKLFDWRHRLEWRQLLGGG